MNRIVSISLVLGIALFSALLAIGFSDGLISNSMDIILGGDEEGSIFECNPADSTENCPGTSTDSETQDTDLKVKKEVLTEI